jgi:hypothetical protein
VTRSPFAACLLALLALNAGALALMRSDGASAQVVPGVPVPVPDPTQPLPGGSVPVPPVGPQQLVLNVGDTARVNGVPMGCQVTLRGGRPAMECRRDGHLAGTYGTFMTDRSLRVARFRSADTARVIFSARQGGGWRACGKPTRAARTAARTCR